MQRDLNRSLNMLAMQLNGAKLHEIGAEFSLSRSRVASLINWTLRILMAPKYMVRAEYPDHCHWEIPERRQHKDFWFRQIDKARQSASES